MFSCSRRDVAEITRMDRESMACPALPLCGLAVTEAERSLPDVIPRLEALLQKLGFPDSQSIVVSASRALSY